jgi:hypothetical protein
MGTSPENHHHDATTRTTKWKDLEKHASEKRRCLEVLHVSQNPAVRGASDMEAGACCNDGTSRHTTPHFRHTYTHTHERRATQFSEDTHECTQIRTQKEKSNNYKSEQSRKRKTEYQVLDRTQSFPEGKVFISHFIHFVPMELILLFRTDHAKLG